MESRIAFEPALVPKKSGRTLRTVNSNATKQPAQVDSPLCTDHASLKPAHTTLPNPSCANHTPSILRSSTSHTYDQARHSTHDVWLGDLHQGTNVHTCTRAAEWSTFLPPKTRPRQPSRPAAPSSSSRPRRAHLHEREERARAVNSNQSIHTTGSAQKRRNA